MLTIMEDDQSLGEVNATIGTSDTTEHFHVPVKEREAPASPSPVLTSVEEFHGGPVIISTHELPAPYGCRYAHKYFRLCFLMMHTLSLKKSFTEILRVRLSMSER